MAIANQSAAADHVTSLASDDWCILRQMFENVLTCGLNLPTSLDDHGFLSNNVSDKKSHRVDTGLRQRSIHGRIITPDERIAIFRKKFPLF